MKSQSFYTTPVLAVASLAVFIGVGYAVGSAINWASSYTYSDGSRHGVVQKFSKKGMFCRSYEGELVLGGIKASQVMTQEMTGTRMSNLWEFSTMDARAIEDAMNTGRPVTLHYKQRLAPGFCATDTTYIIDKVGGK